MAPSIARTRGGSVAAAFRILCEPARVTKERDDALCRRARRQLRHVGAATEHVEQRGLRVREPSPGLGPPSVHDRVRPEETARHPEAARGDLSSPGALRGEPQEVGGGHAGRKCAAVHGRELPERGWVGTAGTEAGVAPAVVDPLADALQGAVARQTREGLRERRGRDAGEVGKAPEALSSLLDTRADPRRRTARRGLRPRCYSSRDPALLEPCVKFLCVKT